MPLHRLTEAELRSLCKEAIEALEFWLRRVIDITLQPLFGDDYINASDPEDAQNIVNNSIKKGLNRRAFQNPEDTLDQLTQHCLKMKSPSFAILSCIESFLAYIFIRPTQWETMNFAIS